MTPLFGSRRRAEEFAARADSVTLGGGAIDRGGSSGGRMPGPDPEADALLELVGALRGVAAHDDMAIPGAAFSRDLRERLLAEASTVLVATRADGPTPGHGVPAGPARTPTDWSQRRRRFTTATATLAILVGGSAGMASAAQESLPGEALYPVKRGLEKAAVTLSGSTVDRGRELLTQASGRLEEVQGLMDEGAAERTQIPGTLHTFNEQATEGATLLISSYRSTDDETAMVTLRSFAASSMDTIEDLATSAPDQALTDLALTGLGDAAVLMQQVDTAADQVCPGCSDLPALPTSDVLELTTAGQTIGFPGVSSGLDVGGLLGGTTDAGSEGMLAPLLPGLSAGQDVLDVPGTPEPVTGSGAEEPSTGSSDGDTAGGDTSGSSGTVTDPPASDPPATDPPATDPPATDPPATDPPATDPPATDPPATDPPATDPPATDPPATDPPATDPPATDPPATDPPATDPPATEPSGSTATTPSAEPTDDQSAAGDGQSTEAPTAASTPAADQP